MSVMYLRWYHQIHNIHHTYITFDLLCGNPSANNYSHPCLDFTIVLIKVVYMYIDFFENLLNFGTLN